MDPGKPKDLDLSPCYIEGVFQNSPEWSGVSSLVSLITVKLYGLFTVLVLQVCLACPE